MTDQSQQNSIFDKTRKSWSEEQDNVLNKLVKKFGSTRWTIISRAMAQMFQLTNKTGKQCRQRWVNHLDPNINKNQWTIEQQKIIFQAHKTYGNKWKNISKLLKNRTDNSIKNHFYSILRKGLRRINKIMGDRKSTQKVKEIRTSVLSKLSKLNGSSNSILESQSLSESKIYDLLFQFSLMKSEDISEKNLSTDIKNNFNIIINHLRNLSNKQKAIKQQSIAQNKEKKFRKNSQSIQQQQIEGELNQQIQIQIVKQNQNQNNKFINKVQNQFNNYLNFKDNQRLQNSQINQKEKSEFQYEPFQINFSQPLQIKKKEMLDISANLKNRITQAMIVQNQKDLQINDLCQKGDQFNLFPNITINIEQQSLNMSASESKDAYNFNLFCFNTSPMYGGKKLIDQIMTKTPRINSPSAFNLYGTNSTAHTLLANIPLGVCKDNGISGSNNQYDKIIEQLKNSIDYNSSNNINNSNKDLRINSSRNSQIQNKNSFIIYSLTPKAH